MTAEFYTKSAGILESVYFASMEQFRNWLLANIAFQPINTIYLFVCWNFHLFLSVMVHKFYCISLLQVWPHFSLILFLGDVSVKSIVLEV